MSFTSLPADIIREIIKDFKIRDIHNTCIVCKFFYTTIETHLPFWKDQARRRRITSQDFTLPNLKRLIYRRDHGHSVFQLNRVDAYTYMSENIVKEFDIIYCDSKHYIILRDHNKQLFTVRLHVQYVKGHKVIFFPSGSFSLFEEAAKRKREPLEQKDVRFYGKDLDIIIGFTCNDNSRYVITDIGWSTVRIQGIKFRGFKVEDPRLRRMRRG